MKKKINFIQLYSGGGKSALSSYKNLSKTEIKQIQKALNAYSGGLFQPLQVDGIIGPKTIEAIKAFQKMKGLGVDGLADKQTLEALTQQSINPNSFTPLWSNIPIQHNDATMYVLPRTYMAPLQVPDDVIKAAADMNAPLNQYIGHQDEYYVEKLRKEAEDNPEAYATTFKVVPYTLPNLEAISDEYHEAIINKARNELRNKSKDEIKAEQQLMADAGYYDKLLYDMTPSQIKEVQQRLKDRGFYEGQIDGIIGPKTIQAYRDYNVDGIYGARTNSAVARPHEKSLDYSYVGNNFDQGCAEFVTKHYNRMTGMADSAGVTGNAWRMLGNIKKKGGTQLYNIYEDPRMKAAKDVNTVTKLTKKLIDENPFNYNSLQIGDIVGLFNPTSSWKPIAFREGTTYNTHVGICVGFDVDGMPIIQHNFHNRARQKKYGTDVHTDRADDLQYGGQLIAVAMRPKGQIVRTVDWDLKDQPDFSVDEEIDNENLQIYRKSLSGVAPLIKKAYPNVDTDEIQQMALAILQRETGMMNKTMSKQRDFDNVKNGNVSFWNWASASIRDKWNSFKDPIAVSSDLTKTKFSSLLTPEANFLGINSPSELDDPVKAAGAVMMMLAKYNNYAKEHAKRYPQLKLTDDDIWNATVTAYNKGAYYLQSLGFDDSTGKYAPEELVYLRKSGNPDYTMLQYNATTPHRVLKHLGMDWIDDLYRQYYEWNTLTTGTGTPGYAGAARQSIIDNKIQKHYLGGILYFNVDKFRLNDNLF